MSSHVYSKYSMVYEKNQIKIILLQWVVQKKCLKWLMVISLIAAMALNRVIGKDNRLPWNLPADLQVFKEKTVGHCLLMGRHTFDSIGRILPNRISIVVSRTIHSVTNGYYIVNSIEAGVRLAREKGEEELFVIGGGQIYAQILPFAHKIYLTRVHTHLLGDTYFPLLGQEWAQRSIRACYADARNAYDYDFIVLEKMMGDALDNAYTSVDPTG